MPLKHFELGELQLTSKTSKVPLCVSCSVTLDLPPSLNESASLEDNTGLTSAGELWISKATACRMDVKVSVLETVEDAATVLGYLTEAIAVCSAWEDLGLTLRREESPPVHDGEVEAKMGFVVNHPDLSSESLAPTDIPCGRFLGVSFDFCYGGKPTRNTVKNTTRKTTRNTIQKTTQNTTENKRRSEKPQPRNHQKRSHYELRARPRTISGKVRYGASSDSDTVDDDGPDLEPVATRRRLVRAKATASRNDQGGTVGAQNRGGLREDVALMVRTAFYKLLGVKKATCGVRVRKDLDGPSLIDIAPAVWNLRYLEAFSSRAEHIPWIASCLSSLDAESPSLRQKITRLTEGSSTGDGKSEVQRRLHMLVHRGLDVSPLAKSRSAARVSKTSEMGEPEPEPDLDLNLDDNLGPWGQDALMDDSQLEAGVMLDGDVNGDFSQGGEFGLDSNFPQEDGYEWVEEDLSQEEGYGLSNNLSQAGKYEWLDLSQASFIMDENGQHIPFEELDNEEFAYQLVPLV